MKGGDVKTVPDLDPRAREAIRSLVELGERE
jgi:hypothetical protein